MIDCFGLFVCFYFKLEYEMCSPRSHLIQGRSKTPLLLLLLSVLYNMFVCTCVFRYYETASDVSLFHDVFVYTCVFRHNGTESGISLFHDVFVCTCVFRHYGIESGVSLFHDVFVCVFRHYGTESGSTHAGSCHVLSVGRHSLVRGGTARSVL